MKKIRLLPKLMYLGACADALLWLQDLNAPTAKEAYDEAYKRDDADTLWLTWLKTKLGLPLHAPYELVEKELLRTGPNVPTSAPFRVYMIGDLYAHRVSEAELREPIPLETYVAGLSMGRKHDLSQACLRVPYSTRFMQLYRARGDKLLLGVEYRGAHARYSSSIHNDRYYPRLKIYSEYNIQVFLRRVDRERRQNAR